MQRLSVSVDDELAAWIESTAEQRGVSKAQVVRDAIETAQVTGLIEPDDEDRPAEGEIRDRLEEIEARVSALEQASPGTGRTLSGGTADVLSAFEQQLSDRPPQTEHGEQAVVCVFELLLEDGPLQTGELKERMYPEFEDTFSTPESMWQSIQRYFDEIPGIEKVGRGEYAAAPDKVVQQA